MSASSSRVSRSFTSIGFSHYLPSRLLTLPCTPVYPCGVEVHQRLSELLVIQNALEDGLVLIHPTHDGVEEHAVEYEPEVVERVPPSLSRHCRICYPSLLELVEQQLVPGI